MTKKYYLVCERSYEYNDEIYQPSEGVHPTVLYVSQKQANEVCFQKNLDFLLGNPNNPDAIHIADTCYNINEIFNESRLKRYLSPENFQSISSAIYMASKEDVVYSERGRKIWESLMRSAIEKLSPAEQEGLIDSLGNHAMYEVCEVIQGD